MIIAETERLWLRPYADEDVDLLHEMFSDPETMKYYPGPFSRPQTLDWMARNRARYERDGYGLWAVCLKSTGQLVGDCGLVKQNVEGHSEVEIGYHTHRSHWSCGYASEAAAACRAYGFHELGFSRLISIIDSSNAASIRVAEKIGFTYEKEVQIFNKNHVLYSGYSS